MLDFEPFGPFDGRIRFQDLWSSMTPPPLSLIEGIHIVRMH